MLSNGTTRVATSATWGSDAPGVATVSPTGFVTGVGVGAARNIRRRKSPCGSTVDLIRFTTSFSCILLVTMAIVGGCSSEENRRGFTYDGSEYERMRELSTYDATDRATLQLREKQPIYFLGLPMSQIPTDNWLLSELIHQIKPNYVIETGTLFGGSAVYYAGILEFVNADAKVITIDINEEQIHAEAKEHPLWKRRVTGAG